MAHTVRWPIPQARRRHGPGHNRNATLGGQIMPTKPPAALENGVHHTQVRVRFGDTDPYGIVYFVSYFRYCHRAIEEFLRACGLRPDETFKNVAEGFGLPIVEAWGRFRRPSRYGDLLRMETRIQEFRTKSLLFRFEFYPETGHDLLAEGTATLVAIGPDWKARKLPERVKAALSQEK
jgi:YbgC/YbaW family acyl-CoA thioester hydrolase